MRRHYQNMNNRYQSANVTLSVVTARDADRNVADAAARVRRGVASHRHKGKRGRNAKLKKHGFPHHYAKKRRSFVKTTDVFLPKNRLFFPLFPTFSRIVSLLTLIRHMSGAENKVLRRGLRPIGSKFLPQFAGLGVLVAERQLNGLFHFGANLFRRYAMPFGNLLDNVTSHQNHSIRILVSLIGLY